MDICIIGGGITGLVAALRFARQHAGNVTIYEQGDTLGGLLSSYMISNTSSNGSTPQNTTHYTIEKLYHHIFSTDTMLLSLFSELNLSSQLHWFSGSTGYYIDGTIHPLTTPFEILRYSYLSLFEKARLGIFTLRAKKYLNEDLDSITAEAFIKSELGEGIYTSFFEPLLRSKFGPNVKEISAAWLVSRVAIRSDRGTSGERLGYLEHGFSHFIDALETEIIQAGGTIHLNTEVTDIRREGEGWRVNDTHYDVVVSTISPTQIQVLGGLECEQVPYQCSICMTLALPRDVLQNIYWVNMGDDAPFGAVIGHTNFAPYEWYHEHIIYLAAYAPQPPAPGYEQKMIDAFCNIFSVQQSEIRWHRLAIEPYAGPLYKTGYRSRIQSKEIAPHFFAAGMFSRENYPERSINGSVAAGEAVVQEVLRTIKQSQE
ncbi:MAG: NAD(P)/FAD-dependent oxidoreductase [Methanomicrobiales archaeon]|jgi:protoporphyrinogen oxidase|nr:NAD(P)/FAD-dependent oxidoreductase [Methanomicrobiales archaeon]